MYKGSSFSTSLPHLLLSFILAILASVKEPGGLQSIGSPRVSYDLTTKQQQQGGYEGRLF